MEGGSPLNLRCSSTVWTSRNEGSKESGEHCRVHWSKKKDIESPWLNSRGLTEGTFVFHASGRDHVHYVVQQVLHLFMALKKCVRYLCSG